jgi:hypothetical protein
MLTRFEVDWRSKGTAQLIDGVRFGRIDWFSSFAWSLSGSGGEGAALDGIKAGSAGICRGTDQVLVLVHVLVIVFGTAGGRGFIIAQLAEKSPSYWWCEVEPGHIDPAYPVFAHQPQRWRRVISAGPNIMHLSAIMHDHEFDDQ